MIQCLLRHERAEVWCGDCLDPAVVREVMGDRVANAMVIDAPYSEKTHSGHASGKVTADRAAGFDRDTPEGRYAKKVASGAKERRDIDYSAWASTEVETFTSVWHPRVSGWQVSITDHVLAPEWAWCFKHNGLLTFPPLPLVETGSRVRVLGDGPSNWTCFVIVGRPRNSIYAKWGTLRGAYIQPAERLINSKEGSDRIVGGKPIASMIQIVSDYSREGNLVVDPCAGGGTTLLAALRCGRRAIGIEKDPERARLTADRVRAELAGSTRFAMSRGQTALFDDGATG